MTAVLLYVAESDSMAYMCKCWAYALTAQLRDGSVAELAAVLI